MKKTTICPPQCEKQLNRWQLATRKLIACGTAAVVAGTLMAPASAFAAESVTVGDTKYTEAAGDLTVDKWHWDGADDMSLNGYSGGPIAAMGDLTITYTGTNFVGSTSDINGIVTDDSEGEVEQDGNLTLVAGTDDSSITVEGDQEAIYADDGAVTIQGGTVNVKSNTTGIQGYGGVTINNSNVAVEAGDSDSAPTGIAATGKIDINGSKVTVTTNASGEAVAMGLFSAGEGTPADVVIKNSEVNVTANGGTSLGIWAMTGAADASITIDNSKVTTQGTTIGMATSIYTGQNGTANITLNNSSVQSPEGIVIGDTTIPLGDLELKSKTLLASDGSIVGDMTIVAGEAQTDPAGHGSDAPGTTTVVTNPSATTFVQTGDSTSGIFGGAFAAALAAISSAVVGAFALRRNQQ